MIYVVLGKGFSGTTLISELMHHAGVNMIDADSDEYDKGGKYEHPEFKKINYELLGLTDERVEHLRPQDCPKGLTEDQKARMLALIDRQEERYVDWGFKDPRAVATYPLWRDLLPKHRIVGVYRSPDANWPRVRWRGLRRRYVNAYRAYAHLRQWDEYNAKVLEYGTVLGGDFLLIGYEALMTGDEELDRLSAFVGYGVGDRRKPWLYRSRNNADWLFRSVKVAMDRLSSYSPMAKHEQLALLHAEQTRIHRGKEV